MSEENLRQLEQWYSHFRLMGLRHNDITWSISQKIYVFWLTHVANLYCLKVNQRNLQEGLRNFYQGWNTANQVIWNSRFGNQGACKFVASSRNDSTIYLIWSFIAINTNLLFKYTINAKFQTNLSELGGSRAKDDLWVHQDNLSLKYGAYILNLNSVLNLSYECNTSYHLWSVNVKNLECFY